MSTESIRAFICFEIPAPLREYLEEIIRKGKAFGEPVSWVKTQNIHLTLKFLGNITLEQVAQVSGVLEQMRQAFSPFEIQVDRVGAFPNFSRPRVFWVGCQQSFDRLSALAGQLEVSLAALGFEKENRKFSPHLTLGRVRKPGVSKTAAYLQKLELKPYSLACRELVLMKSELKPSGAIYTPIKKFPLLKK